MKELSITEFAEITASKNAVPGGGSVAALCGGLSAALVEMVANLTIGNKKYSDSEKILTDVKEKATKFRNVLLDYIEKDSNAYAGVIKAYMLPKTSDEEKNERSAEIQKQLQNAVLVPLEIASSALDIMELSALVVKHGNKNAVTDGMVSAMMARTSALAALLNAKINLSSIKDKIFVADMSTRVREIEVSCKKDEEIILSSVSL